MKIIKLSLMAGLGLLALASLARAQAVPQPDQKPRFAETLVVTGTPRAGNPLEHMLTFSGPVGVPGITLPAGSYLFAFPTAGSTVIQVMKADRSNSYAMIHTIPVVNVRRDLTSDGYEVTWKPRVPDAPPAIGAWFLPNQMTGYEFVYPEGPKN